MKTPPRPHIGLAVSDLAASRAFYDVLLGPPTKVKPDYAKYSVASPPLNLSLNLASDVQPALDGVSHFGIEVDSPVEVAAAKERFDAAGLETRFEQETTCCYAVQDKVWVVDPDGRQWEVFVVLQDAETHGEAPERAPERRSCCAPDCCA